MIPDEYRFVKKVALGESHCIILVGDGTLWGVGSNEFGQLGLPILKGDTKMMDQLSRVEFD